MKLVCGSFNKNRFSANSIKPILALHLLPGGSLNIVHTYVDIHEKAIKIKIFLHSIRLGTHLLYIHRWS